MHYAAQAYGKVAKQTASPRELEAGLLLRSAARMQAVREAGGACAAELDDALVFNRKIWSIFLTSVTRNDHPMPAEIRQNIANLGLFVMTHTVSFVSDPRPERLGSLIAINRELAAGLLGRG